MAKKILFLLAVLGLKTGLVAQTAILDWAKNVSGASYEYVNATVTDVSGNVYAVGSFSGTVDFDPGPATFSVTAGHVDIFLLKLDPSGNFLWAKTFGDQQNDAGNAIAIDNSGNILITGIFTWVVDFDPGPGVSSLTTSGGGGNIFVCKYTSSGALLWAANMGSTNFDDEGLGITTDASGNVYTTGYFAGTADFDPGPGTYTITAVAPVGYTSQDIFVSKLSSAGNFIWATVMGGNYLERARAVAVDNSNNVYITGYFSDTCDFAYGPYVANLVSDGGYDAFICKLSPSGNYTWARKLSGTMDNMGISVGVDVSGNVYSTGYFWGTVDLDPGAATYSQTAVANEDLYISKLNSSGNFVWAKTIGTSGSEQGKDLFVSASGNIYTTGMVGAIADFDPGPGTFTLSTTAFVSVLNASGNFVNAMKLGGTSGSSINLDSQGNIYTGGYYTFGPADFDPGPGVYNLPFSGNFDGFVDKMHVCYNTTSSFSISACNSYTSPGGTHTWTTSGTYMETIPNARGCDSVITINLTVNHPSSSVISASSCNTYVSPGGTHTWTTSGTYMDTIPNVRGCDSVITINLIVNHPSSSVISASSCNTYISPGSTHTWTASGTYTDIIPNAAGCDSVITINLTIRHSSTSVISASSCNTYVSPGGTHTWTTSGTYMDTIPNAAGCDSVITINLTVRHSSASVISTSSCNAYTSPGGTHTWITSGTYMDTIPNAAGCDSVITINLTIRHSSTSVISASSCNTYISPGGTHTWTASGTYMDTIPNAAGCDSVITINLTVNHSSSSVISASSCNAYTSPGGTHTWTTSGTYMDTIPNAAGCDSVITIHLAINSIDTTITNTGLTLISNESGTGTTYQWLDCNNLFSAINGETNQSFTAVANGYYAVQITQNACTDTSSCSMISVLGIIHESTAGFYVYPNPTTGDLYIKSDYANSNALVTVTDMLGQVIYTASMSSDAILVRIEGNTGLYMIEIKTRDGKSTHLKVLKN